MVNYGEISTEELEQRLQCILSRNAHWKSCRDGSYELALHTSGYHKIIAEIERRKRESNE